MSNNSNTPNVLTNMLKVLAVLFKRTKYYSKIAKKQWYFVLNVKPG